MPIPVQCPQCGKSLRVPDEYLGKKVKCPCGHAFVAAAGPGAPPPAAAPQQPQPAPGYAPQPQPAYAQQAPGGYAQAGPPRAVTPPETFEKLYKWYVILGISSLVLIVLTIIVVMVGMSMAASASQRTFESVASTINNPNSRPSSSSSSGGALAWIMLPLSCICYFGSFASSIGAAVCYLMLLYKEWDLIQDGQPRTTPGQAIGFMFIPFFNFYWIFVAVRGLAEDLNSYAQQRGIQARDANVGLVTMALILSLIPCISIVGAVMLIIALGNIKNTACDIAAAKLQAAG